MDAQGRRRRRRLLFFFAYFLLLLILPHGTLTPTSAAKQISIGVILNLQTKSHRKSLATMLMAVDDFYALRRNHSTTISLRVSDSKHDAVDAAAAAVDLIKNSKVAAIIGPVTSGEADFVALLGNATQTPIVSYSASSPSLSVVATPYFVRATVKDSDQSPLIAAIVKSYAWHEVIPIYEDSNYGAGVLPSLIDALQSVDVHVPYRAAIAPSASDDRIAAELYRLKTLPTRVFVVHMMPSLASRLFRIAAAAEMVAEGYVWIATDGITNSVHLAAEPGVFKAGPELLAAVKNTNFHGLSGEFQLYGGELDPPPFEIINVVGKGGRTVGFWTPASGISNEQGSASSSAETKLKAVIWPGESTTVPLGWEIPTNGKKLQIAVPVKNGFNQFVNVERDVATNATMITGYCIDVFDAVMAAMPYSVRHDYIPFKDSAASYDDLVSQVYYKNYDAVVGDTTMLANRSNYVDFTLPYTESGVSMVVPLMQDKNRNGLIFLKPLTADLWLGALAFFFFTGLVVWAIEHRINPEFRGRPTQQIGTALYFVFSILVFSHKEKLESNLSRLVVVIWVFVVMILTSSYTASLTSILTVQKLQPKADNIDMLLQSKSRIGYQDGSFVFGMLQRHGFSKDRLQNYSSPEQYKNAMLNGSALGGVDAIFDELPYLNLFLSEYRTDFAMVGRKYKTDGFGFVFPRGSPLLADVSKAILKIKESDMMMNIERKWFGNRTTYPAAGSDDDTVSSSSLDVWRFGGLFLITGTISISSIMLYIGIFIRKEFNAVDGRGSIWDKMAAWARHYDGFKDDNSKNKRRDQKLSYEDAVNTDDGLLQLSGHLGKSDVSAANFASPVRVVVSGCYDKHNRGFAE